MLRIYTCTYVYGDTSVSITEQTCKPTIYRIAIERPQGFRTNMFVCIQSKSREGEDSVRRYPPYGNIYLYPKPYLRIYRQADACTVP